MRCTAPWTVAVPLPMERRGPALGSVLSPALHQAASHWLYQFLGEALSSLFYSKSPEKELQSRPVDQLSWFFLRRSAQRFRDSQSRRLEVRVCGSRGLLWPWLLPSTTLLLPPPPPPQCP